MWNSRLKRKKSKQERKYSKLSRIRERNKVNMKKSSSSAKLVITKISYKIKRKMEIFRKLISLGIILHLLSIIGESSFVNITMKFNFPQLSRILIVSMKCLGGSLKHNFIQFVHEKKKMSSDLESNLLKLNLTPHPLRSIYYTFQSQSSVLTKLLHVQYKHEWVWIE